MYVQYVSDVEANIDFQAKPEQRCPIYKCGTGQVHIRLYIPQSSQQQSFHHGLLETHIDEDG